MNKEPELLWAVKEIFLFVGFMVMVKVFLC